jgi:hypothetical protein
MKRLKYLVILTLSPFSLANQISQSGDPLSSSVLRGIKMKYEACVFQRGSALLTHTSFRDAMEYAPMACRKELLMAKKFLLDSAFRLDAIDQLVSSIEEGVKIDLAGRLIKQLEMSKKGK